MAALLYVEIRFEGPEMIHVVRLTRLEHGFSLLTLERALPAFMHEDPPLSYALYRRLCFCFASPSLDRALDHLKELNAIFNSAVQISEDEKRLLAKSPTTDEIARCQDQNDFVVIQGIVASHEEEIGKALLRDGNEFAALHS